LSYERYGDGPADVVAEDAARQIELLDAALRILIGIAELE